MKQGLLSGNIVDDLLGAVVWQAAADYAAAVHRLLKAREMSCETKRAAAELRKIEKFFLSDDFSCYTKLNGSRLLSDLRKGLGVTDEVMRFG